MTDAIWWIRSSDDAGTNIVCCVAQSDPEVGTIDVTDMFFCSVSELNDVTATCVI